MSHWSDHNIFPIYFHYQNRCENKIFSSVFNMKKYAYSQLETKTKIKLINPKTSDIILKSRSVSPKNTKFQ